MTTGERFFSGIIAIATIIISLFGYYSNIEAMKGGSGDGAGPTMQGALSYVERQWREGDIIFTTDDGPWINLAPYTDKPIYKMPACPVWGALSPATRTAMGVVVQDLETIEFKRAWIFAPLRSPLHPKCYVEKVAQYTQGEPVYVVDDGEWIYSAVWLVEK